MLVLMGGGTDVDDAFKAMIAKARGGTASTVDVVILRTSGSDGYNACLMAMNGVDSVESIVIKTRAGASAPEVLGLVNRADVLFIAGGDQSTYIAEWAGTPPSRATCPLAAPARAWRCWASSTTRRSTSPSRPPTRWPIPTTATSRWTAAC
ncbi:hypothetical protein EXJ73_01235 [Pelomonas aquatica]|jgi:cyanophycinase-like exopeptidase|uniref:Cyanophycinase n=1 Tax=Pelomonas aquatica TaxID=431058 RepID=A0A9X4LCR5_9BURK|nr:hypothetical protein [Pelomonas aquatica]